MMKNAILTLVNFRSLEGKIIIVSLPGCKKKIEKYTSADIQKGYGHFVTRSFPNELYEEAKNFERSHANSYKLSTKFTKNYSLACAFTTHSGLSGF